ncbi:MAG: hypothetical protein ACFFD4_39490, partial [Candidatus Odinarchaeota archaeon]
MKLSIKLGIIRFKRLKQESLFMFLALTLAISSITGIVLGTRYLQTTILQSDLNIGDIDINIGVSLSSSDYQANFKALSGDINDISLVNKSFVKYHARDVWNDGGLRHVLWVGKNNVSSNYSPMNKLDILSYDPEQFRNCSSKSGDSHRWRT